MPPLTGLFESAAIRDSDNAEIAIVDKLPPQNPENPENPVNPDSDSEEITIM